MQSISQYYLTTRLIHEISTSSGCRFVSTDTLYRRLNKLQKAGVIHRQRFLLNGEYAYYLTNVGVDVVKQAFDVEIAPKARNPIGVALQGHEFDVSRFWIKFFGDATKLGMSALDYWRDGMFVHQAEHKKLFPDGVAVLKIRGKAHVFCLELDRSSQTSGIGGNRKAVIRQKYQSYAHFFRYWKQHPSFQHYPLGAIRVMFVCGSEQRLLNLVSVAQSMGLGYQFTFTTQRHYLEVVEPFSAYGWDYRKANLFASNLFSRPTRAPPSSLL